MGLRVPRLTPRRQQLLWWALSFALWYTLFGFFFAPRLLRAVVLWQLPKQIGRPVVLEKIRLNPFTIALTVRGFCISEPDGTPFLGWDEVYVNLDPTGLLGRKLVVAELSISNAYAHVQANHDGSFNFTDILTRFPSAPASPKKASTNPMIICVGQLRLIGARVLYKDLTRSTPFATMVGPIDVRLHDFSTDPAHRDPYAFTAVTELGEKFTLDAEFHLGPLRSEGDFAVEGITLKKYAPYQDEFVTLTIHSGRLDVRGHYRVAFTDTLALAQLSNAVVHVTNLRVAERGATNDVMELGDLTVAGIDGDLLAQTVTVDTFTATGGRVAVRKLADGLPNLGRMFMKDKPVRRALATATHAPAANPRPWQLTLREMRAADHTATATGFFGDQRTACREFRLTNLHVVTEPLAITVDDILIDGPRIDEVIPAGMTNLFPHAASTTTLAHGPGALPTTHPPLAAPKEENSSSDPLLGRGEGRVSFPVVQIGAITITNGVTTFTDESIEPPVAVVVTGLAVRITGFATDTNGVTAIHVAARIDNVAPVDVTGRVNPFALDATTAMKVALHGIDLTPLGGYAGKYAGYLIRKGKLSVDLQYDIHQRALKASNDILVDQFTFGEKTDSPHAVKLPVKLGVAILKDRNGQIKIDIPIEGRIDNPQFRYWGAVRHVLGDLFTKIFTAPFSLLGSMFGGGGEELSFQTFAPGSTELIAGETKKLDVLIKALTERPALNLDITGAIDPVQDVEPLKRQKLLRQLLALRAERSPGQTNALTPMEYAGYLREAYAAALPRLAPPPPPPATRFSSNINHVLAPGAKPTKAVRTGTEAKKAAAGVSVEEMEHQYLPLIELTTDDYRQLARSRAASVVAYLKTHGAITDDRLLLSVNPKAPVAKDGARVVFGLE